MSVLWIWQWLHLSARRWQLSASLPASQRVFTHVIRSISDTELDPTTFWLEFKLCHFAKPSKYEIVGMKLHLFPHESMHGRPFLSLRLPFIAWSVPMSALKAWMGAWKDAQWHAECCFYRPFHGFFNGCLFLQGGSNLAPSASLPTSQGSNLMWSAEFPTQSWTVGFLCWYFKFCHFGQGAEVMLQVWNCIFSCVRAYTGDPSFPLEYLSFFDLYLCLFWRVEWVLGKMLIGMPNAFL